MAGTGRTDQGTGRTETLMGFEALGLLTGTRRAGNWSGVLPEITGLSVDSRRTEKGHLFAALPGSNAHGATFIPFALRMGAAAILTDAEGLAVAETEAGGPLPVPVILSDTPRRALALAASRFFGRQPEVIVAVTGTNGKTSVASFTRQIWETIGERAVNFGTVGVEGAVAAPLSHTTPEPITLHQLLADLADQGVTHAAMEASSHGLDQARLDGVRLAAAGFTNLTRDHLDYHKDAAAYLEAKLGLFTRVLPRRGTAVINLDDRNGQIILNGRAGGQPILTVGRAEGCDLRIIGQRFDATGQDLVFAWQKRSHKARLDLIGGFQAHNALVAAGLAIGSGSDPAAVFAALESLRTVRGRMERAATRANGAAVFVDYAHTPDALTTALNALRPHVLGRLLVVFGAGGDRDRGKRPLMGAAAAAAADQLFVTDDNPRSEDPGTIRAAILAACPEATEIGDRAEAILTAVDALQPGDALLIAGKGHETGQIIGQDVLPFDDIEQASVAVAALDGLGA